MSDEKKEKLTRLRAALKALSPAERQAMADKVGVLTIEGRSLSLTNQCLLAIQCPGVTVVGGYRQWIKAGRQVRGGEHGHCIWIPLGKKDEDGDIEINAEEKRFILGTVFDIAQTDEVASLAEAETAVT